MAQAARLNLRMQKELKLLLTDPPPNASFPSLSDESSLTSIDAHLRGPEGTVYADGVFKIKIKIPERYPFQPPVVTFGTPIYHPNIDTGGRICLDILNLPPKGSWQPSLNISTVLTSIGLLLSEPNPDDGLMDDVSKEYKYNKQAFDQKARSMTEKYANVEEIGSAMSSHDNQAYACPSTAKTELEGSDASVFAEDIECQKRSSGTNSKLSLDKSLGSSSNRDSDKGISKKPTHDYLKNHVEAEQLKEAKLVGTKFNMTSDKLKAPRHKLSLKLSGVSHSGHGEGTDTNVSNHHSSSLGNRNPFMSFPDMSSSVPAGNNQELVSGQGEDGISSCSIGLNQEGRSLESAKAHQRSGDFEKLHHRPQNATKPPKAVGRSESGSTKHHIEAGKENQAPIERLPSKPSDQSSVSYLVPSNVSENKYHNDRTGKHGLDVAKKQLGMVAKLPRKPLDQLQNSNKKLKLLTENSSSCHSQVLSERSDVRSDVKQQTNQGHDEKSTGKIKQPSGGSPIPEAAIVLDSEDSEEEKVPVRSKLSLARKGLSRKRKSNV